MRCGGWNCRRLPRAAFRLERPSQSCTRTDSSRSRTVDRVFLRSDLMSCRPANGGTWQPARWRRLGDIDRAQVWLAAARRAQLAQRPIVSRDSPRIRGALRHAQRPDARPHPATYVVSPPIRPLPTFCWLSPRAQTAASRALVLFLSAATAVGARAADSKPLRSMVSSLEAAAAPSSDRRRRGASCARRSDSHRCAGRASTRACACHRARARLAQASRGARDARPSRRRWSPPSPVMCL